MTRQHYKIHDPIRDNTTTITVKSEDINRRTINQIVKMAVDRTVHVKDLIQELNEFDKLKAHAVDKDVISHQITTKGDGV